MDNDADVKGGPEAAPKSSAKALNDGYNQTYVILKTETDKEKKDEHDNDVFFRCGNWCYMGQIQFGGLKIGVADLSLLIPTLQKQQGSLRYYCNSMNVPSSSDYYDPLQYLRTATEFVANEMTSVAIEKELRKMSSVFPWIDADGATTYFELTMGDVPSYMDKVGLVASKTYSRGLIIISIYTEKVFYFVIQNGEGDQPLLDVHFPDVSKHGQGLLLQSYNDPSSPWRKLTLWHVLDYSSGPSEPRVIPKIRTVNISSANYQQTYCVMKTTFDVNSPVLSLHHDVLFRFGSWCYSGRVQLTPTLSLSDIPFVIPALRMQQGRLDYYCDVNNIPTNSPFAKSLEYMQKLEPLIESQIYNSEEVLRGMIDRLSKMGLSDTVVKWLEGDPSNSFFEFKLASDERTEESFKGIELIASKCYHPSGVISITIVFEHTIYVSILEGDKENPLLDSRFPDVSGKGRGYQIQAHAEGLPEWPELRKVSVWQTVGALEQELKERVANTSQTKTKREMEMDEEACAVDGETLSIDKIRSYQQSLMNAHIANESSSITVQNSLSCSADSLKNDPRFQLLGSTSGSRGASSDSSPFRTLRVGLDGAAPDVAEEKESNFNSQSRRGLSKMSDIDVSLNEGVRRQLAAKEASLNTPQRCSKDDSLSLSLQGDLQLGGLDIGVPLPSFSALDIGSRIGGNGSSLARPHHIPKLSNSLGKRMDEIRKTMGDGASDAPWDSKGRPLNSLLKPRSLLSPPLNDGSK